MFYVAREFNANISGWDVSKVTDMAHMFNTALAFNQPLDNWDTSSVTNMAGMFRTANVFDQDLGSWDVSNVTDAQQMFEGVTLSTSNYDALLLDWSVQTLQPNVIFSGGDSVFCDSATEKQSIIDTYAWVISDGGNCILDTDTFKMTWGVGSNDIITIPTRTDLVYNYTVDWGDGTVENFMGDAMHEYQ